jgi:hypothetical protein
MSMVLRLVSALSNSIFSPTFRFALSDLLANPNHQTIAPTTNKIGMMIPAVAPPERPDSASNPEPDPEPDPEPEPSMVSVPLVSAVVGTVVGTVV